MKTVKIITENNKLIKALRSFLNSRIFPFVTAAVMLFCYYLNLDIVTIYYLAVCGILILLLLDDITPFITLIIFMDVIISYDNSPAFGAEYYFLPSIFWQIIFLVTLLISIVIYRIAKLVYQRRFKPTAIFYGLCALSVCFLLNGLFSMNYTGKNLMYGLFQTGIYLGIFMLLKDNVRFGKEQLKKIALSFFALSLLLITELTVAYATYNSIYVDGEIKRNALLFGWGVYNTMGMLLLLCVPSVIYLAINCNRGYLFTLYSVILVVACVMSLSRQTIIGIIIIYPLCLILLFYKKKDVLAHSLMLCVCALIVALLMLAKWDKISGVFKDIFSTIFVDGEFDGNGRIGLFKTAIQDFKSSPAFGVGFFGANISNITENLSGLGFIPLFYHNTYLQMLASCGILGFAAYCVHRVQTIISLTRNFSMDKYYLFLSIAVILILSLVDVHMFDILPTLIYSALLAVMTSDDKRI